jgi:hypothetical protein
MNVDAQHSCMSSCLSYHCVSFSNGPGFDASIEIAGDGGFARVLSCIARAKGNRVHKNMRYKKFFM